MMISMPFLKVKNNYSELTNRFITGDASYQKLINTFKRLSNGQARNTGKFTNGLMSRIKKLKDTILPAFSNSAKCLKKNMVLKPRKNMCIILVMISMQDSAI